MYSGMILLWVGSSIYCESVIGLLMSLAMVIILVLRVDAEELMLSQGLKGYDEYMKKVKYRFFPMIY